MQSSTIKLKSNLFDLPLLSSTPTIDFSRFKAESDETILIFPTLILFFGSVELMTPLMTLIFSFHSVGSAPTTPTGTAIPLLM